jgi:hypothetical protein
MFARDGDYNLEVKSVAAAYEVSFPSLKLRAYIKQLVLVDGPLSSQQMEYAADYEDSRARVEDWGRLIRSGGDLVCDIIVTEGATFSQGGHFNYDNKPCYWKHQAQYLEPITTRPIQDFIAGKRRNSA